MVAVLAVFAHHLWGWPRGGFVGIDVFFVLTGFLITCSLLSPAKHAGAPNVWGFYMGRVRRIVPAAALVLGATYVAAVLVFPAARARATGVDALFALVGVANWRVMPADSPIAHFWALSIAEQFYLVWPLLLLLAVGVLGARRRSAAVAATAAVLVVASFGWALYQPSPLDTFARVWELGVGALLAAAATHLARIPVPAKPVLSWAGVLMIGAGLALAGDSVPWALLPVAGTALVLAAGVGGEPQFQPLLCNRVSTYIGDLSYSLYLVHLPVIVIVAALMHRTPYFYLCVLAFAFGFAVACHHFVENPLRHGSLEAVRTALKDMERGLFHVERRTKVAAVGALVLVAVGLCAYAARPDAYAPPQPSATHQL